MRMWQLCSFILIFVFCACSRQRQPLEVFMDGQKTKISEASAYIQADFIFWGALYEPTLEDIDAMRAAWNDHAKAFPESKTLQEIEKELRRSGTRTILVSLFVSEYEKADLLSKSLGWSVYPVPLSIKELSENDSVLRTLFPNKNLWARYYLLKYNTPMWNETSQIMFGYHQTKIQLPRKVLSVP